MKQSCWSLVILHGHGGFLLCWLNEKLGFLFQKNEKDFKRFYLLTFVFTLHVESQLKLLMQRSGPGILSPPLPNTHQLYLTNMENSQEVRGYSHTLFLLLSHTPALSHQNGEQRGGEGVFSHTLPLSPSTISSISPILRTVRR